MRWGLFTRVLLVLTALPLAASAAVDARSQRVITQVLEAAKAQPDADRRAELLIRVAGVQVLAGDTETARQTVAGIEDARLQAQGTAAIAMGLALRGDLDAALSSARHPERPDIHVFVLVRIAEALVSNFDTDGATRVFDRARQVVQEIPAEYDRARVRLLLDLARRQAEAGDLRGGDRTLALAARLADEADNDALRSAVEQARQQADARHTTAGGESTAQWLELLRDPEAARAYAANRPAGVSRMEFFCELAVERAKRGHHGVVLSDHVASAFAALRDETDPYNRAYGYLTLARTMGGINAVLRKQGINDRVSRIDVAMREAEMAAEEVTDPYFGSLALADVARGYLLLGDEALH